MKYDRFMYFSSRVSLKDDFIHIYKLIHHNAEEYFGNILLTIYLLCFSRLSLIIMNLNSSAIFDSHDMKTIITDLFNEQSIHVNSSSSSTTKPQNQPSLNEPITTKNDSDRHYCLVIFNNPKWSQQLRKRSQQVRNNS